MLSILIPVYNFNVTSLVTELNRQAKNLKIDYEIILIDDASKPEFKEKNTNLNDASNVEYIELEKNIGRSKIRNLLAKKAKYKYLIFMDCDSAVSKVDYVKNYIFYAKGEVLVCGGRTYEEQMPDNTDFSLAWKYGSVRETTNAEIRNQNPNRSFLTNNFFISKSIFNKISFDEKITKYGHEDTLFGYELKKIGINIIHINNSLIHIGLEKNKEFLKKTKTGIENLKYIAENYNLPDLFNEVKLWKTYKKLGFIRFPVKILFKISEPILTKNLTSINPNLFLFDLFKLGYLCSL